MTRHTIVALLLLSVGSNVYSRETALCVRTTGNLELERMTAAKRAVDNIKGAVTTWMLSRKKAIPPCDLNVLVKADAGEKPVLGGGERALIDPWNTAFKIELKGKRFAIISAGPDMEFGTVDDIRSDMVRKSSADVSILSNPNKVKLTDSEIIDFVAKELKSVWDVEDSDFAELTKKAQQEDAESMYLLACQAVKLDLKNWPDVYRRYMVRAAELGCVKAQLAIAIQWNCCLLGRWNSKLNGELKMWRILPRQIGCYGDVGDYDKQDLSNVVHKIKVYYGNSVSAGYECVTNLINILDREAPAIFAREKAVKDSEAAKKVMEEELRKAEDEARQKSSRNGETSEPLLPIEEALALAEKGDGKGYYQLAVRYAKGDGVKKDYEAAARFLKKAYDAKHPTAVFAVALGIEYALGKYVDKEVEPSCVELVGASFDNKLLLEMFGLNASRWGWGEIPKGITNEVYIAKVRSDYEKAKSLGIGAAEKELARFERRIELAQAKVKADLEKEAVQKKNDELARRLIEEAAGKTRQFMPFPSSQRLPYQQALEGAEKSDPKSYYWLAYYFAKGEVVDRDGESALKFLKKAVDANDPVACYTFGLLLEGEALQNEDGRSVGDQETSRGFGGLHFNLRPFGTAAWYTPVSKSGNKCLTNSVAVAHVESLYQKAINGGFPYATNDIARLHKKITDCKKRIAEKQMEKARREEAANKALSLLDDPTKMSEEDEATRDAEAERELWRSWPTGISDEEQMDIRAQTERKFNCVLMYDDHLSRSSTNSWRSGRGVSCILKQNSQYEGDFLQKIDASGKIVGVSRSGAIDYVVFEELKWLNDQENGRIAEHQEKWAKEHSMTLDEAKTKHAKWTEENPVGRPLVVLRRPGMLGGGSLRARRLQRQQEAAVAAAKQREELAAKVAERQAQAEQEKLQREAERAEQRQQLLFIQEELRRVREAKATAEKK